MKNIEIIKNNGHEAIIKDVAYMPIPPTLFFCSNMKQVKVTTFSKIIEKDGQFTKEVIKQTREYIE